MEDKLGKIDHHLFEQFISTKCGKQREEVFAGPQFGVDVSVVDLPGEMAMAMTSDPLSLVPTLGLEESAWLSVQLMANDMATTGFAPMYGQFVLNLPSTFPKSEFKIYWEYIHQFCARIGIAITGVHTGFIEGQNSTIAGGGTFITIAPKSKILISKAARVGDAILVTKTCAISSAAILAMSFPETIKQKLGVETYHEACSTFYQTSSLEDALAAVGKNNEHDDITAMHDVTEGGVMGAIYELATASGHGATIYNDRLPIGRLQKEVCALFSLDPRHCIGAGSMIITCGKQAVAEVIQRLGAQNIDCVEVGELVEKKSGIMLVDKHVPSEVVYTEDDPYWAAFFEAFKSGWK
ncbi:AIR synthase family protein [Persicitalea jodogahamensis]|uniref:Hydrogenase expression protein n=1 Tax=Persicitalea jodogahamensis TaxID=402147 RepID=A0A8J3D373_9BACT|nr:AIR synthase family protein [Persicitalea jodogahamensis]GHB65927.1 hydrogenase expression protein [Persicitalea jodogahamensis]